MPSANDTAEYRRMGEWVEFLRRVEETLPSAELTPISEIRNYLVEQMAALVPPSVRQQWRDAVLTVAMAHHGSAEAVAARLDALQADPRPHEPYDEDLIGLLAMEVDGLIRLPRSAGHLRKIRSE